MTTRLLPHAAVMAAGMLWATAGLIGGSIDCAPIALTEFRLVCGFLALAVYSGPAKLFCLIRKTKWKSLVTASASMAAFQWCFFVATRNAGASFATWSTVATGPLWADLISPNAKSPPGLVSGNSAGSALLTIFGLWLIGSGGAVTWLGVLTALAGGLSYAIYASIAAHVHTQSTELASSDEALLVTAAALGGGALLLLPAAWSPVYVGAQTEWQTADVLALALLGIGGTAVAYALFAGGASRLGAQKALTFQWVQPVLTEFATAFSSHDSTDSIERWGTAVLLIPMLIGCVRTFSNNSISLTVEQPQELS